MSKLIASGIILALCFAAAAQAQERPVVRHHHRHVGRPATSAGDIVVRTPPMPYPEGFISNGFDPGMYAANGLSGDDSYPPPRGFHGGLYSYGAYAMGPGGPYDRVEGCIPGVSCWW
jgi:hypothetical protein